MKAVPSGVNSMSKILRPNRADTSDHVTPPVTGAIEGTAEAATRSDASQDEVGIDGRNGDIENIAPRRSERRPCALRGDPCSVTSSDPRTLECDAVRAIPAVIQITRVVVPRCHISVGWQWAGRPFYLAGRVRERARTEQRQKDAGQEDKKNCQNTQIKEGELRTRFPFHSWSFSFRPKVIAFSGSAEVLSAQFFYLSIFNLSPNFPHCSGSGALFLAECAERD